MAKHNVATATFASMKAHKRKASDFYPTPADVTQALLDWIARVGGLRPGAYIGEPACGNGAMARVLEAAGYEVAACDLRHTGYGLGGYDYLRGESPEEGSLGWLAEFGLLDAVITNPPFEYAEAFIRRAIQQAPFVAMLLKSNYAHAKSRLPLFRDHPPSAILPLTWRPAFLEKERGNNPLMDVTWFVWIAGEQTQAYEPLPRPAAFPDISKPLLSVAMAELGAALEDLTEAHHVHS